jgi:hypothetical protein
MIALFGNYLAGGKFAAAQILYSGMRGTVSEDYIRNKLIGLNAPRDFAQYWVLLCETAFGRKNIQR